MGATTLHASFRITFTDFMPDPDDSDCRRRAVTVPADRITFVDSNLVLWVGDTERACFSMETVESVEVVPNPRSNRREPPDELRARYPNYGKPWDPIDEQKLLRLYREGQHDSEELATVFGRQPTAIRSRLARLGLEQL
ncbi:hypothetical protein [Streptomyces sp. NBC_00467]|uniref:hypothetical protein n=1 Tax=Streptomyces sp. NBC_00467 TaxID=2975752 RepID=UPI002E17F36D